MLSACSASKAEEDQSIETGIYSINKSGSITLTIGPESMKKLGYEPADIISVRIGDAEIEMPIGTNYADEYAMHQVGNTRSNKREDYAYLTYLSDAEFANFRAVETTGMGRNTLYRSSSPIDPALERNDEADNALRDAGIRTVMNMADSEQRMKSFADFGLTAYSQCDIIALDMIMTYDSDDFRKDLADGFRYIASHEGPYLIHCVEGKDRTGYAAAILECLMGASADEVVKDYMITYYNFYGIEPGTDQYKQIAESNIEAVLAKTFGIKSIYDDGVDLRSCSEKYLKEIGMNDDEIASLREGLALSY